MVSPYFENTFEDYVGGPVEVDHEYFYRLITEFVDIIWRNVDPNILVSSRADLYVGQAGKIFLSILNAENSYNMLNNKFQV